MKLPVFLSGLIFLLSHGVGAQEQPRAKQIKQLIDNLDHADFRVREKATQQLQQLGDAAIPALEQALQKPASAEAAGRLKLLLKANRPSVYEAHANGWHWVYSTIAHAQTFEATGGKIKTLQLRVAQLSGKRPAAPLQVEIRDRNLQTIFVRGTIDPAVLRRDFFWQPVALKHVSPLKPGQSYVLLFHSRDSTNKGPWAINAIYQDVYPHGRHWYNHHEDFFFAIDFQEGKSVRVGPKGETTNAKTPFNSGAEGGGLVEDGGPLRLQGYGILPQGKLNDLRDKKK